MVGALAGGAAKRPNGSREWMVAVAVSLAALIAVGLLLQVLLRVRVF
jgi:hypothetical protein